MIKFKPIVDLFLNFKLFKDMPIEDYNIVKKHHEVFFNTRKFPRFFQSYLYLKSERKYFFYGWIDDCFVLIKKKKEFGNKVFYLALPPIHISGDLSKELALIELLRVNGVKTKLSEEDIQVYDYSKKLYRKEKDNIEHIYLAEEYLNPSKKFRYYHKKLINSLEIKITEPKHFLSKEDIENNELLANNWHKYKKLMPDKCYDYFNDLTSNIYFELLNNNKNIITNSINEVLVSNKILMVTNYSDYYYQLPGFQSNKALHYLMMQYWLKLSPNCMINSGSAGWDKGLYAHKKQLRAHKELQIFDTAIENRITEEEYQLMCRAESPVIITVK